MAVGVRARAGAAVLLRAHFDRLHGAAHGAARLAAFMALLRERRMAVSFEMVTGESFSFARVPVPAALLHSTCCGGGDRRRRPGKVWRHACLPAACHGHHGQLPQAEYLVATAAHRADAAQGRPVFLSWQDFLAFCLEQVRARVQQGRLPPPPGVALQGPGLVSWQQAEPRQCLPLLGGHPATR